MLNKIVAVSFGFFVFVVLTSAVLTNSSDAQGPRLNQRVQLPSVSFFNVRTVVSVPDGGSIRLGGVSRHASGRISRGIPGISGPWARPFQNRASGYSSSASGVTAHARIILARELEEDVMAEAMRRDRARRSTDPNGTVAVQRKADFISRNIGRTRR